MRQCALVGVGIGGDQAVLDGAVPYAFEVEPGAVIGDGNHDFVAFLRQRKRDLADGILAGGDAGGRVFEAVGDAVAQHVFERAGHLVQHRAVEFGLAVADVQVGALAGILGRLSHHAMQAVGQAFEGHHAHAHQALRQFAGETRLGDDGRVGLVEIAHQVLLHGRDVVHAFGHHPRHFLEAGEAVEFERIELQRTLAGQGLLRLHLGLGLDLDLAQLLAQANHVFRQFEQ